MREEEAGQPEAERSTVTNPVVDESATQLKIFDPAGERLERRVCIALPQSRNLVVEEGLVNTLQLLAHNNETLDGFLKLLQ